MSAALAVQTPKIGVVIAAGRCANTVKVRVVKQMWHKKLRKNYSVPQSYLADDFLHACVPGDIVSITPGLRTSRHKKHVVTSLVSPMRTGSERIQPEGIEGWLARREEKRVARLLRLPGVVAKAPEEGGVVGEKIGDSVIGLPVRGPGQVMRTGAWKEVYGNVMRMRERTEKKNAAEKLKATEEAKEKGAAFPIYPVFGYRKHGAPAVPMGEKTA
ncbi:hypothetical protein FPQ18DRAFT_329132 [Pyronema domesticum]|uniref:Uncharacterized protein n=1 Tax=Pyronema omphalodes (strain CBS 100304) TaxID=1076935 RepID=U4LUN5_PYROM|nr:hypothetical protein FPQ18DRAFT_329132 [Pyronema domesticum]CCX31801.1 Similar to hypothetical protein [Tuber melanosporum Mel28]; acc. no. XP_002838086 [Pyronema omphalodes CBS 100304]